MNTDTTLHTPAQAARVVVGCALIPALVQMFPRLDRARRAALVELVCAAAEAASGAASGGEGS